MDLQMELSLRYVPFGKWLLYNKIQAYPFPIPYAMNQNQKALSSVPFKKHWILLCAYFIWCQHYGNATIDEYFHRCYHSGKVEFLLVFVQNRPLKGKKNMTVDNKKATEALYHVSTLLLNVFLSNRMWHKFFTLLFHSRHCVCMVFFVMFRLSSFHLLSVSI